MYKKKIIFILCLLNILVIISGVSFADTPDAQKRVYVIVADKLTLRDLESMKNLNEKTKTSGLALMNTKGSNSANSAEGFLSINSSSRAYGVLSYANAFNLTDEKLSLYKKRVGDIKKGQYEIGNTEINRILKENEIDSYGSKVGALGDNIHKAGLKTSAFGNSDTDELSLRLGSLIAMDSRGLIDYGDLDGLSLKDDSYPYGIKTDYEKLLKEIEDVRDKASLIVVDTGDLKRLDLYSSYLNDTTFNSHRENMLDSIDKFIEKLNQSADEQSLFIVVSPTTESERIKSSKLSPIIMWQKNEMVSGILNSSTTRREGIVTNLDIAPTIANFLDIPTDNFVGNNIGIKKSDDNMEFIKKLDEKTNLVSVLRSPFLKLYNIFSILVIVVSALFLILNKKIKKIYRITIKNFLLIIISAPVVFLLMPLLNITDAYLYILCSLILFILIIVIINLIFKDRQRLWALLLINVVLIIFDISTGSNLTKTSVIGYDPIIGARYFGIGNELVGVLLASVMIIVSVFMDKFKSKLPLLLLLVSVVVVGLPNLGANVGGTISVLFGSIIFLCLAFKVNLNLRRLILMFLGVAVVILSVGAVDIFLNPNPTHLGVTLLKLFKEGPVSILSIVTRKLSVNIRLIKTSTWGRVLYTTLLFATLMFKVCKNRVKDIYRNQKYLDIGLISLITGSIIGFLVNDSGLLLASISSLFMIITLFYLIITNMEEIWRD